ncbi:TolC family outer membrane protein [Marivivens donghaensis]|uniref:TolC family outer membrane protein n=1 Tax=Marivivens donghaensis TaxID=1699413 RepID=UPI00201F02E6|nr:TolC family outer membrane protein [Marivivens donghaensis]MCL7408254.1 TolC family outer membrane protein [Marivivens donghaensis]MDN3704975.1 TolC family outer membrane protein [Marivivens donghaensis]
MFRKTFASAAAVVALIVTSPAAFAETLGGALVSAYNSSGLLDQNRAVLRAADEDVASAMASLRPTLSYSANATHGATASSSTDVWTETYSLISQLTLYQGGANKLALDASKELVLGAREDLVAAEQNVLLSAISAYLGVRTAQEFVNLRQSNVRVLSEELRAAQDRFSVGEVTRTDVSLAEAQLASARSLLAVAQGDLIQAQEQYRVAVGTAPVSLQSAPRADVGMTQDAATEYALRAHPSILSVQHAIAAAELGVRIAQASNMPSVDLSASFTERRVDGGSFNDSTSYGVSVSGPIYAGGAISSAVRKASAQRDQARAGLHLTTLSVEQGVTNAFSNYRAAVAASDAYRQGVAAAQLAFDGVREEAAAGSRTTIDVLNAEQSLLDARANLVQANANVVLASYNILYATGLLTAEHLNLPVTQYDVEGHYNMVANAPIRSSAQGRALDRVLQALE